MQVMYMKKGEKMHGCCGGFKAIPIFFLIIGIMWLLNDMGIISIDIPWLPLIVIVFSLKALMYPHHFEGKK